MPSIITDFLAYNENTKLFSLKKDISDLDLSDKFWSNIDEVLSKNYSLRNLLRRMRNISKGGFKRKPYQKKIKIIFNKAEYSDNNVIEDCKLKVTALKKNIGDGVYAVTLMLVNTATVDSNSRDKYHDEDVICQPLLSVKTENNKFTFISKNYVMANKARHEEDVALEMLYRNELSYGTGMGTAIDWCIDKDGKGWIRNEFLPMKELAANDFSLHSDIEKYSRQILSMKYLSDIGKADIEEKVEFLTKLQESYSNWIEGLLKKIPADYKKYAQENINVCMDVANRIRQGINLIKSDEKVRIAFELTNRAMYMQRVHLAFQQKTGNENHYSGDECVGKWLKNIEYSAMKDCHYWRPFQIAFLLMSIAGIADEKSQDREVLDLIWFPTGGGKTEAYLGLSAFTIFYRRLAYPYSYDGTNIIMRYTLRLLTAQQFTRAATLICACEYIRQQQKILGEQPITIGLWIGSQHTPNKYEEALREYKKLQEATVSNIESIKSNHNKFQLLKCPWCGTQLVKHAVKKKLVGDWAYRSTKDKFYINVNCTNL